MFGSLLDVQASFLVARAMDSAPLQRCMSCGRRNTRDIAIDTLGDQGADFLRGFAFWSIRSSGLLSFFFSRQVQYFREMAWKNCKTHWYEAISSALNLPCLKQISHRRFVFDLLNFEFLRKSRRIYPFWSCAHSFFAEVLQTCFVFDLSTPIC